MSKILVTGDWHIDSTTLGYNRLRDIWKVVDFICEYSKENEIDHILHLGDWFDPGGINNCIYTAETIKMLRKMSNYCDLVTTITGNHDVLDRSDVVSVLTPVKEAFEESSNVFVYERPNFILHKDYAVVYLPFVAKSSYDKKAISDVLNASRECCTDRLFVASHYTVPGAIMHGTIKDASRGEEVDLPDLRDLNAIVLNGHYHIKQTIDNVMIPGSPIVFNFGERTNSPSFFVIDTEKD